MSADRDDPPALRPREAQEIDLEIVDENAPGPAAGAQEPVSIHDFMKMGPGMVSGFLRNLMMEKLKKWFIRNLLVFTVLALLAMEYKWPIPVMYIWAVIAGLQLAIIVFIWRMGSKQASKLTQLMRGRPPGSGSGL